MPHRLTTDATYALIARAQAGDAAATETLLAENEGLANKAAQFYRYRFVSSDFEDLQQMARIGMVLAIRRFDLTRKLRFSTYAWQCMRGQLTQALRDDAMIRTPAWWADTEEGRKRCPDAPRVTTSLDQPAGPSGDATVGDLLPCDDTTKGTVLGAFDAAELSADLESLLALLKPQDREALLLYFGTDRGAQRSLQEVGEMIGVTRECARQRINRAIGVIRNHCRRQGRPVPPTNRLALAPPINARAIVALHEKGVTDEQIAARLGCSVGTVRARTRASRSRKKKTVDPDD